MIGTEMKETYTCPRCATKFGDRSEDDNIWFIKNAGYINLGCCVECETPEEGVIITKTWKDYLTSTGLGESNA
jgi:ribosomal protein L37AE/L43A